MKNKSIITLDNVSRDNLNELFNLADKISENEIKYNNVLKNKVVASLFFEPSTRTRFSFESAVFKLGGNVISLADAKSSSASKGESLSDTVKTVSMYSDLIVMRHNKDGSALVADNSIDIPLINAGDGAHYHPTQTMLDLYTIYKEKKTINNLTIGVCGDLKFGRTVHTLVKMLSKHYNVNFVFISPDKLKIPDYVKKKYLTNMNYKETSNLEDNIKDLDVLYMTRVQKERFFSEDEYIKLKDKYILNNKSLKVAKEDLIIMHPLPRNNEIAKEIDNDKRAVYFKQVKYGLYIRMALISLIIGDL